MPSLCVLAAGAALSLNLSTYIPPLIYVLIKYFQ
ncbi:exported hypothetical protein [Cupriavidus phytorum]|uniref:Uncharacterized protein n=1 Tax=Cupriavidus taiwanensis TaxID=164546 RepID=A0A375CJJ0_9BURK|nr:exported hypothetical protein [Cupriavidus taiwanensis]